VSTVRKVGFVPPRYGDQVIGGAEAVMREAAHGLAARGWDIEILTTCARDHFTWANEYPAGVTEVEGITLRRFPTVISTARAERALFEAAIHAGTRLSIADQYRWMNDDLRVPDLFHHLLDHADDYDALVFAPYLFWTSFACGQVAPERTILMPCLHDEPYATLDIFQPLFSGAHGLLFLSEPEHELAHRLFTVPARHTVTGAGIEAPTTYDPDGFRKRFGIDDRFVLYSGRREGGKGWDHLLDAYAAIEARSPLPLKLVTCGAVDVHAPSEIADRVIDLGFLSDADRNDAMAAADAYLQPSQFESFSRTIMEAWLAGTLVIGNAASAVVGWHCERSGAGLTYDDDAELEQCLRFVAAEPDAARRLAAGGRDYVLKHYSPESVLDRVEAALEDWLS
jgi:glycosyltransferase involved in cell wall biosynthesis